MNDKYIGKRLDGCYDLRSIIGEGGMANVYLARDIKHNNREVAIKILKDEYSGNEEFRRRFREEAKAVSSLTHANVVRILDVGFSTKMQYLVMEYVDGITLKEFMDSEGKISPDDAIHFTTQILRGLAHAHNRGIVHRDIKPQNIMLNMEGTVKIMDFGIAKLAREEGHTASDQAIGTVHYISPEQAKGDPVDARTDIYSVGVMLYEMLTGVKPFDSAEDNPLSVAVMHINNQAERPRDINPDIPSALEEIIMHAMEKNPARRYQNAMEMLRDIDAYRQNNQIIFGYFNTPQAGMDEKGRRRDVAPIPEQKRIRQAERNAELYEEIEEEETRGRSLVVPILLAITIVVIIVAAVIMTMFFGRATGDAGQPTDPVPEVVGMYLDNASMNYPNVEFIVAEEEYTDEYEEGMIYKQSEKPGDYIHKNSAGKIELAVAVSKGIQMVKVPDLTNYKQEEAKASLETLGLTYEIKKQQSSLEQNIPEGHVIRTEPKPAEELKVGSSVILYVSQGIEVNTTDVPTFTDMTLEEAEKEAERRSLVLQQVMVDSSEAKDTILSQEPEPGATLDKGATVTIQVSNGIEPEGEVPFNINLGSAVPLSGMYTITFTSDSQILATYQFVAEQLDGRSIETKVKSKGERTVQVTVTNAQSGLTAVIGTYEFNFAKQEYEVEKESIDEAFQQVAAPIQTVIVTVDDPNYYA